MKNPRVTSKIRAFTLVEILISSAIFLLATSAILAALLYFLRAERSYSQTAFFNSKVRLSHERTMQDLRNATSVTAFPVDAAEGITFESVDLSGGAWTISYYKEVGSGGVSLMRRATPASGSPVVSTVYSGLSGFAFHYYDRRGNVIANPSGDLSAVKALRLEIAPIARHRLVWGTDDESIRSSTGNVINAIVHFRNS